jgi:hypothetical protein
MQTTESVIARTFTIIRLTSRQLWLKDGHLHLIPLSVRSSTSGLPRQIPDDEEDSRNFDPEAYISEKDGVEAVNTGKYQVEAKMETSVWERIIGYVNLVRGYSAR